MLTKAMRESVEALAMEFTQSELMDLGTFLQMVKEVKGMDDGSLAGLALVILDKGNPESRWNLARVLDHEIKAREKARNTRLGNLMANYSSDLPAWKDAFPEGVQNGTMVPPEELEARLREQKENRVREWASIFRPTKPQPGDE